MSEIKELREQAGLTQKEAAEKLNINSRTFGAYERQERTPDFRTMDKIRRVLGRGDGTHATPPTVTGASANSQDHIRIVEILHVGAGPVRNEEHDEIVLDDRLFKGVEIDFDRVKLIRVHGSSMEPHLSDGQLVFFRPVERVRGDDLYVYWSSLESEHTVGILSNEPGNALQLKKLGVNPQTRVYEHREGTTYERADGRTIEIDVVGRVKSAVVSPVKQIAQINEAARSAANAIDSSINDKDKH
jgi:transcriptional regulator with XRE-family HTH domain